MRNRSVVRQIGVVGSTSLPGHKREMMLLRPARGARANAGLVTVLAGTLALSVSPAGAVVPPGFATEARRADWSVPLHLVQSQPPLVIEGPVAAPAGGSTDLPVSVNAAVESASRYVVIYKAPPWLSFSIGERVGDGIWLIERDKLDAAQMVLAPEASGQHVIAVATGNKSGAIEWVTELAVKVVAAVSQPAAAQGAITAAVTPPAPTPARPAVTAPATAAADTPATGANATVTAQADPKPGVTWESLVGGGQPNAPAAPPPAETRPPAAPPAPPAAAPAAAPVRPAPAAPAAAPPSPGPAQAAATALPKNRSETDLIEEAKHIVRECTSCHNLYGTDVGIPVMVGLTVDRFIDTMYSYRTEKRDHQLMQVIAKSLSEEEIQALALYLGRIKPAAGTAAATGGAGSVAQALPPPVIKPTDDPKTKDRISRWTERAEEMLAQGDIAQARLLLERAAEHGHGKAAFVLATSYDPNALPWVKGMGVVAEPLQARRWYLVAKSLGEVEADRRLLELPEPR
ncbi:MAG: hypothetical protein NW205_13260 [Hyphomicrobiaceae bacterium]|nr:hypothetical protein [Hyphomicrobiaceae bacterium]